MYVNLGPVCLQPQRSAVIFDIYILVYNYNNQTISYEAFLIPWGFHIYVLNGIVEKKPHKHICAQKQISINIYYVIYRR